MDLFSWCSSPLLLSFSLTFFALSRGVLGAKFTFVNKCDHTVWPGILANAGTPRLGSTGFELPEGSSRTFQSPTGWSGRFWGRTGCNFDGSEPGSCSTGDCGSGQVECNGAGASPPATLAEFTLGSGGLDFYDVSLVDGYNLPMVVESSGGSGACASTGCVTDLNLQCPAELRVGDGGACKSACEAFGSPQYCCSGAYNSPAACKPSVYSEIFKSACPRSYSYAYDDPTSTFTCRGADYTVTFCPSKPSQKSTRDDSPPSPPSAAAANGSGSGTGTGTGTGTMGSDSGSGTIGSGTIGSVSGSGAGLGSGSMGSDSGSGTIGKDLGSGTIGSDSGSGTIGLDSGPGTMSIGSDSMGSDSGSVPDAMLADGSWLAGLAMGDSTRTHSFALGSALISSLTFSFILSFLYL